MLEVDKRTITKVILVFFIITSLNATLTLRNNSGQENTIKEVDSSYIFNDYSTLTLEVLSTGLVSLDTGFIRIASDPNQITSCDTDYLEINIIEDTNDTLLLIALPSLIASIGLISKKERWVLRELPVKDQILDTIDSNPGLHFRELCRALGRQNGVIQYHLWILESKEGLITSYNDGGYTRYFKNSDYNDKDIYFLLQSANRRSSTKKVLMMLHASPEGLSRQSLAKKLDTSPQYISRISKRLQSSGIIDEYSRGRQKCYKMTEKTLSLYGDMIKDS